MSMTSRATAGTATKAEAAAAFITAEKSMTSPFGPTTTNTKTKQLLHQQLLHQEQLLHHEQLLHQGQLLHKELSSFDDHHEGYLYYKCYLGAEFMTLRAQLTTLGA